MIIFRILAEYIEKIENIIGKEAEKASLLLAFESNKAELIAMYGRRRAGWQDISRKAVFLMNFRG